LDHPLTVGRSRGRLPFRDVGPGDHRLVEDELDGEPVSDWHVEPRDRLQRLHLVALLQLGEEWSREQRYAKAVEAYRRVLARDELHEEAIRALMRALARLQEGRATELRGA
jgi:DNA-binding SARP family transcriptional activator